MTTLERLQSILTVNYPLERDALTLDAKLEDLQIDSLGIIELLFSIDDEFKITVPHETMELKTIGDVVELIDRLQVEQGLAAEKVMQ